MPRKGSPYGPAHERFKRDLQRRPRACQLRLVCEGAWASEPDHDPPLSRHRHVEGTGCCRLRPACGPCQRRQATLLANETRRGQATLLPVVLEDGAEPEGFPVDDPVWLVPWLDDLIVEMPSDAVWPRFMSAPHPDAVGSLGQEFEAWCFEHRSLVDGRVVHRHGDRPGMELRWFQRLVARRLLEVNAAGELVWLVLLLTLARQVGKSWLLQLLLAWRLHQAKRFGRPQRLLHMSIQMAQVRDVMAPEIEGAEGLPHLYDTLDNNNETSIEVLADGSKWVRIVRGTRRGGGAYGQSGVSVGVVDEAWSIPASVVDEGLEPTIVEGVQPWLMLVSTAHRMASPLMLDRRAAALDELGAPRMTLLIEWSTPRHYDLEDVDGWRMASPHWTPQREQLIAGAVRRALSGFASDDDDEPDPVESVRAQWLNQWPAKLTSRGKVERLVSSERWAELVVDGDEPLRLWVAVADNLGRGAGVVAVAEIGDGRFEIDGWTCVDRDAALEDARATLRERGDLPGVLVVEPALRTMAPDTDPVTPADIRFGLPLLRELTDSGRLVHDATPELDDQMGAARVAAVSGGLALKSLDRSDLVRAAALAVRAAIVDVPMPAIHSARSR